MNPIVSKFRWFRYPAMIRNLQRSFSSHLQGETIKNEDQEQMEKIDRYISDRIDNVFNIILADIHSWQQHNIQLNKPNPVIYEDPFACKDQVLRDLLTERNHAMIDRQYNLNTMFEEEFQMDISDNDFQSFKTLKDLRKYLVKRWHVRRQLNTVHPYDYGYHAYWY